MINNDIVTDAPLFSDPVLAPGMDTNELFAENMSVLEDDIKVEVQQINNAIDGNYTSMYASDGEYFEDVNLPTPSTTSENSDYDSDRAESHKENSFSNINNSDEHSYCSFDQELPDQSAEERQPLRKSKRTRRGKKKYPSSVMIEVSLSGGRKKKLYEQGPFTDPEKERCRLNALNAKINRDRKKKEREGLAAQLNKLKQENAGLRRQSETWKSRALKAEKELMRIRNELAGRKQFGPSTLQGNTGEL